MQRFPYTPHPQFLVGMPLVEIQLAHASYRVTASALVDSGAAIQRYFRLCCPFSFSSGSLMFGLGEGHLVPKETT